MTYPLEQRAREIEAQQRGQLGGASQPQYQILTRLEALERNLAKLIAELKREKEGA